jgi:TonB-linked SusC/RagA family outer membrane protein
MKKVLLLFACLCILSMQVFAQRTVTGTVTGADDGMGLPGVSVLVKGTSVRTVTDVNGAYSVTAPAEATTIVFEFMGMETQEVAITGDVVNAVMKSTDIAIDDVVVTAFGIKREKREVVYQTQSVADDELTRISPNKVTSGLVGKVAGLQINIQNNGVNPSSQVLLRGLRSISGDNSALIVIDGAIASQGALDNVNPNDIENVNVLKGPNAAALYGSQAVNGVLVVNTKKGASQKITVGVNSAYTMEKVAYMPKFQSKFGTGWEGAYDAVENTNWGPRFDGTLRQIGPTFPADYPLQTQIVPYAPVKDNLLAFFETGKTINNTAYISGGDESSKYYISFGDQRTTGIIPDDEYKRNTIRANASKKFKNVELSANTSFFTDNTDIVGTTVGDQDRPLYWFLLNTSANIPLENYKDWSNPLSYGYANNYYNAYYQNPYWAVGTNRNIEESNRFIGNVSISWDILKWLNLTTRIGANNVWGNGLNWRAAQTYDPDLQPSAGVVSSFVESTEFQTKSYTADMLLSGDYKINDAFNIKGILGATVYTTDMRQSYIRADNLSVPGFYDVSNGTGEPTKWVNEEVKRTIGLFADITLGYNSYLFLNLSGRNDWTSTLAKDNNNYFYPQIGVSFVATDAISALKDNPILSFAKLTLSNATVYNDLLPYQINERFQQADGFPFGDINGFDLSRATVDANITKEKIQANEIGLNLTFLKSRIWFDGTFFFTKTTDMITRTTPSRASGATEYITNIGQLNSKGIELTLGGNVITYKDFKWVLGVNYSSSEMIVKEIKEGIDEIAIWTTGQVGVYAVVDQAYPQIKANVYRRDSQGRIIVDPVSGYPLVEKAMKTMGKTTPDYTIGLTNTLSYKGISLSMTMDYRTGHVYYEQGSDFMEFTGRSLASVSADRQDFIIPNSVVETSPGVYVENANIPVANGRQAYWTDVYNEVKENYVKDATALKIRELAISYELPVKWLSKTPIKKLKAGFIARNLMTWLPAENHFSDPEFNNTRDDSNNVNLSSNAIGVGGYFQSPPTRTFGFNLNIEF